MRKKERKRERERKTIKRKKERESLRTNDESERGTMAREQKNMLRFLSSVALPSSRLFRVLSLSPGLIPATPSTIFNQQIVQPQNNFNRTLIGKQFVEGILCCLINKLLQAAVRRLISFENLHLGIQREFIPPSMAV